MGSGTTTAQLRALPDGAIYVVPFRAHIEYCKRLLHHLGRDSEAVVFVTLDELECHRPRSRATTLAIDHSIWDWRISSQRQRDLLKRWMGWYVIPPL